MRTQRLILIAGLLILLYEIALYWLSAELLPVQKENDGWFFSSASLYFNWYLFGISNFLLTLILGIIIYRYKLLHNIRETLFKHYKLLVLTTLFLSVGTFLPGIMLPFFSSTKLYFFTETFSLLQSIPLLWNSGEIFLAVVVVLFTIIFPLSKYVLTVLMLLQKSSKAIFAFYAGLNKWSMLDVFVVALMVVSFKMRSGLVSVQSQSGIYFLVVSILLSILMSQFLLKMEASSSNR